MIKHSDHTKGTVVLQLLNVGECRKNILQTKMSHRSIYIEAPLTSSSSLLTTEAGIMISGCWAQVIRGVF